MRCDVFTVAVNVPTRSHRRVTPIAPRYDATNTYLFSIGVFMWRHPALRVQYRVYYMSFVIAIKRGDRNDERDTKVKSIHKRYHTNQATSYAYSFELRKAL